MGAPIGGGQMVDLSHRNLHDDELQSVMRLINSGRPVECIDLRACSLSLEALLSMCQALENAARINQRRSIPLPTAGTVAVQRWSRTGAIGTAPIGHVRPPCWLELGDNPQFQSSEAISYLRSNKVQCCLPVLRCSRRRCLYGAAIHFNCKVRRLEEYQEGMMAVITKGSQRISLSKPETQGEVTGSFNQLQHFSVPFAQPTAGSTAIRLPPRPRPSEELPVPELASRCNSPLAVYNRAMEFIQGQRVYVICSDSDDLQDGSQPQTLQVSLFEELEVLQSVPLGVASTGFALVRRSTPPLEVGWVAASSLVVDPCEEYAYQTLATRKDVDGVCDFLRRAVERLGGEVVRYDNLKAFARECCCHDRSYRDHQWQQQQPRSYQGLLELLHQREERNRIGIRQPGDSYITVEEC